MGQRKASFVRSLPIPRPVGGCLRRVAQGRPGGVLRTAVSMLSLYDPIAKDMSEQANTQKATQLMAQTPTIVTTFDRLRNGLEVLEGDPKLGFAANFLYTLTGKRPDEVSERALDIALTL